MTEAMQRIVDAMMAELARQAQEDGGVAEGLGGFRPGFTVIDGDFDIAKVAAAALTAIRTADSHMIEAGEATQTGTLELRGRDYSFSDLFDVEDIWAGMIGAILDEPEGAAKRYT